MCKLVIAGTRGAMTRTALVDVLAMLGLVMALAGCSGDLPQGLGYQHPADAPGDLPGH